MEWWRLAAPYALVAIASPGVAAALGRSAAGVELVVPERVDVPEVDGMNVADIVVLQGVSLRSRVSRARAM